MLKLENSNGGVTDQQDKDRNEVDDKDYDDEEEDSTGGGGDNNDDVDDNHMNNAGDYVTGNNDHNNLESQKLSQECCKVHIYHLSKNAITKKPDKQMKEK